MEGFRIRMEYFAPRIRKVALLSSLDFISDGESGFTMVAHWGSKTDKGTYSKHFSRELVLGASLMSARPTPVKRTCDFRDDFVREVLVIRGLR